MKILKIKAESKEAILLNFFANGSLEFVAYYECIVRNLPCKVGQGWTLHGVTSNDAELYFIASQDGQKPMKFATQCQVSREVLEEWFAEMNELRTCPGQLPFNAKIPSSVILAAGTTEFITASREQQLLAA